MMVTRIAHIRSFAAALPMVAFVTGTARAGGDPHGHADFEIGRNPLAAHQLVIEGDPDILSGIEAIELSPGVGLFAGFHVSLLPGWESLAATEGPDFDVLLPGHRAALELLTADAGFDMFDPFIGPLSIFDAGPYEFQRDGSGAFHQDLVYAGPIGAPVGSLFAAEFRVVDLAGMHPPSQPFMLTFEVVPEPATALLALAGLMCAVRRHGRRWSAARAR